MGGAGRPPGAGAPPDGPGGGVHGLLPEEDDERDPDGLGARHVHVVVVPAAGRVDAVVAAALPDVSRAAVARWIAAGLVRGEEGVVERPAAKVRAGDRLEVEVPRPVPAAALPEALPLRIVHQDRDVVVVDKAAGMVVHPGAGNPTGTLVNALLHHVGQLSGVGGVLRPGIVHRLDKGTSGLLVVACHDVAHRALAEQIAAHTARRRYLALVLGEPDTDGGTLRSWLGRHPTDRLRFASGPEGSGKLAITHWRVRARAAGCALVECQLETGRTHQIRVHLSEAGLPLLGDATYRRGDRAVPAPWRQWHEIDRPMLHAWRLAFDHPSTGSRMRTEAPPPEDFRAAAAAMGLPLPLGGGEGQGA